MHRASVLRARRHRFGRRGTVGVSLGVGFELFLAACGAEVDVMAVMMRHMFGCRHIDAHAAHRIFGFGVMTGLDHYVSTCL